MDSDRLPGQSVPVPDRLTIWPVDDGRYGLDATFQGASGYERAEHHQADLLRRGFPIASAKSWAAAGRCDSVRYAP
jgi:hypothetical protein